MTTLQEADETSGPSDKKKKKKKPKKKKKKKTATATEGEAAGEEDDKEGDDDDDGEEEEEEEKPIEAPRISEDASKGQKSPTPKKSAHTPRRAGGLSATLPPHISMSTASLQSQMAGQSGHSAAKEVLDSQKTKMKTKSAQPTLTERVTGVLGKWSFGKKRSTEPSKKERRTWFEHLPKKKLKDFHQLMGTSQDEKQGLASMKWDTFVSVCY